MKQGWVQKFSKLPYMLTALRSGFHATVAKLAWNLSGRIFKAQVRTDKNVLKWQAWTLRKDIWKVYLVLICPILTLFFSE